MSVYKSVDEIRQAAAVELINKFPKATQKELDSFIARKTLERVDKDQITIELITSVLEANKLVWEEKVSNHQMLDIASEYAVEASEALKSVRGDGSNDMAINHFEDLAKVYRDKVKKVDHIVSGKSPISVSNSSKLFQTVLDVDNDLDENLHAAENYETVVKLLKNRVTFNVAQQEPDPGLKIN